MQAYGLIHHLCATALQIYVSFLGFQNDVSHFLLHSSTRFSLTDFEFKFCVCLSV